MVKIINRRLHKVAIRTMHTNIAWEIEDGFSNALALLHSSEEDSAEKLRRMLDVCIEKRYGAGKTLAARMPKRFLQKAESRAKQTRALKRHDYAQGRAMKNEIWDGSETISLLEVDVAKNVASCRTADVKIFEVDREGLCDQEDIPRISIPDEGSADGTLCKICNGAKLGPLILLECQDCQDAYHPLCHQPPIVDIVVYDPRFVWRCRRCVGESLSGDSWTVRRMARVETARDKAYDDDERMAKLKIARDTDAVSTKKNDPVGDRSARFRDPPSFARHLANTSQRNADLSFAVQPRRRVGSKLPVLRASTK